MRPIMPQPKLWRKTHSCSSLRFVRLWLAVIFSGSIFVDKFLVVSRKLASRKCQFRLFLTSLGEQYKALIQINVSNFSIRFLQYQSTKRKNNCLEMEEMDFTESDSDLKCDMDSMCIQDHRHRHGIGRDVYNVNVKRLCLLGSIERPQPAHWLDLVRKLDIVLFLMLTQAPVHSWLKQHSGAIWTVRWRPRTRTLDCDEIEWVNNAVLHVHDRLWGTTCLTRKQCNQFST